MNENIKYHPGAVRGRLAGDDLLWRPWWTIRRGLSSKQRAPLFLGSLLLRTILAVAGFYFVSRGGLAQIGGLPGRIRSLLASL